MSICKDIENNPVKPDVLIMNSGLWDLTRYAFELFLLTLRIKELILYC